MSEQNAWRPNVADTARGFCVDDLTGSKRVRATPPYDIDIQAARVMWLRAYVLQEPDPQEWNNLRAAVGR